MTKEELIERLPKYGYVLAGDKWYNKERDMTVFLQKAQNKNNVSVLICKYGYFTIRTAYINFIKEVRTDERDKLIFNNGLMEIDLAVIKK